MFCVVAEGFACWVRRLKAVSLQGGAFGGVEKTEMMSCEEKKRLAN
jgi:hypothetical protein